MLGQGDAPYIEGYFFCMSSMTKITANLQVCAFWKSAHECIIFQNLQNYVHVC